MQRRQWLWRAAAACCLLLLPLAFRLHCAGQGTITVPGCISAVPVDSPIDVEEGYSADIPLVFFFGHASPGENPTLFKVPLTD